MNLNNYNTFSQEKSKEISERTKKGQPIAPLPEDKVVFPRDHAEPMMDGGSKLCSGASLGLFTRHSAMADVPSLSARANSFYRSSF